MAFIISLLLLSKGRIKGIAIRAVTTAAAFFLLLILLELFGFSPALLHLICGKDFEISLGEGVLYVFSLLCQFYAYIGALIVSLVILVIKHLINTNKKRTA